MSRLPSIFDRVRGAGVASDGGDGGGGGGGAALMPFVVAGDPSLAQLGEILRGLERGGASVIEVGIPFTDPIADGPVIQAAMQRALDRGVTVEAALEAVAEARPTLDAGLVAMLSYSIVHRLGETEFVRRAADAGFDGLIVPDLPLEASASLRAAASEAGLTLSLLVAPGTTPERAAAVAGASTGFLYVLSRAGITGARSTLPEGLAERVRSLRAVTDLPLAVGFGISTPEQVAAVTGPAEAGGAGADAAIVGSSLVRRLHEAGGAAAEVAEAEAGELATGLAGAGVAASAGAAGKRS